MTYWKMCYEHLRILEILDDYWFSCPDEKTVKVDMYFEKMNGEKQEKHILWKNPNQVTTDIKSVECAILGTCMVYEDAFRYVANSGVSYLDFTKPENRIIYSAMNDIYRSGDVDPTSVANYLKDHGNLERVGGTPYLAALMETAVIPRKLIGYVKRLSGYNTLGEGCAVKGVEEE